MVREMPVRLVRAGIDNVREGREPVRLVLVLVRSLCWRGAEAGLQRHVLAHFTTRRLVEGAAGYPTADSR